MIIIKIPTSIDNCKELLRWNFLINYLRIRWHQTTRYKYRFKHWYNGTKPIVHTLPKGFKKLKEPISSQEFSPNPIELVPKKGYQ